jgi:anti-sigma factor RsiW
MSCEELKSDLLDLLYGEGDREQHERLEGHLGSCAACREELSALRGVRRDLREWRLPEALAPGRPAAPPSSGLWRLAAAAVLLLALGGALGLSGLQFRYEQGPFEVRLGRGDEGELLLQRLEEQERRHRAELDALRRSVTTRPVAAGRPEQALLERVATMIEESEHRQRASLETAWADFSEQAEAQRRYDMARISAGLSYLDTKSGAQAARTSELMGYLIQAADRR